MYKQVDYEGDAEWNMWIKEWMVLLLTGSPLQPGIVKEENSDASVTVPDWKRCDIETMAPAQAELQSAPHMPTYASVYERDLKPKANYNSVPMHMWKRNDESKEVSTQVQNVFVFVSYGCTIV
jgi:hypothetical protein